jgi:hypothetical protein
MKANESEDYFGWWMQNTAVSYKVGGENVGWGTAVSRNRLTRFP